MIEIREPAQDELDEMYQLRWELNRKVFGLPKGSEIDDKENSSFKVIAFDVKSQKVVGSARLFAQGNFAIVNFAQVSKGFRNQGIGKRLMKYLHNKARSLNVKEIELSARETAEIFYNKLGYTSLETYWCGKPYNQKEVKMMFELS